jgi:hypothetical protein
VANKKAVKAIISMFFDFNLRLLVFAAGRRLPIFEIEVMVLFIIGLFLVNNFYRYNVNIVSAIIKREGYTFQISRVDVPEIVYYSESSTRSLHTGLTIKENKSYLRCTRMVSI